jgi:hypothetical protein
MPVRPIRTNNKYRSSCTRTVSPSLLVRRHNTILLLLRLGLLGPMRLAKRRSDHQREHERGVGIHLGRVISPAQSTQLPNCPTTQLPKCS